MLAPMALPPAPKGMLVAILGSGRTSAGLLGPGIGLGGWALSSSWKLVGSFQLFLCLSGKWRIPATTPDALALAVGKGQEAEPGEAGFHTEA